MRTLPTWARPTRLRDSSAASASLASTLGQSSVDPSERRDLLGTPACDRAVLRGRARGWLPRSPPPYTGAAPPCPPVGPVSACVYIVLRTAFLFRSEFKGDYTYDEPCTTHA